MFSVLMFTILIFIFMILYPLSLFEIDISSFTYANCLIIGYYHNKYNLLQNKYTKKRLLSNVANDTDKRNLVSDTDFYEWLRGFTDAEGCFSIFKQGDYFKFRFQIKLHCDDRPLLEYIQNRLQIGKVYPLNQNSQTDYAKWVVVSKKDLSKLIQIFEINPLNTTKYLDYINWKEAFLLYFLLKTDNISILLFFLLFKKKEEEVKTKIFNLQSSLNNNRTNFDYPKDHKVQITPYWLLGFTEGEAHFGVNKTDLSQAYALDQIHYQQKIIESIREFLQSINIDFFKKSMIKSNTISVNNLPARNSSKPKVRITIRNLKYLSEVLIPFFDKLTFFSKKGLDYQDWRIVAKLRLENKHLTPEGRELITHICNRINKNRMTTNISSLNKFNLSEMEEIDLRINNLLQKSKEGVWVYDNYNLVEGSPFLNISQACKAVGVGPRSSYLNTNKLVQKRFAFYSYPLYPLPSPFLFKK